MGFHLAHVIAELGQRVGGGREAEGLEDGGVDLGGPPAGELRPTMEQHFHEAQHARVLDLDAGDFGAAGGRRQGQALEQGKIHMDVEEFRFEAGQSIGDHDEFLAERGQILQPFVQAENLDRKSTRLNSSHSAKSRMPSSA